MLYYRFGPGVYKTLDALLKQSCPPEHIVLIDNASGDGLATEISRRYRDILVLEQKTNLGYGGAMNFGIDTVGAHDAVLLLTHDCILEPDALAEMSQTLASNGRVGIVGPVLGDASNPAETFSAGGTFDDRGVTPRHIGHHDPLRLWTQSQPIEVEWLDGACQLLRAATFSDVGPFDEDYFVYWEEVAYHARARGRGWTVLCVPSAVAWQKPGRFSTYYRTRNRLRFLVRHRALSTFGREFALACWSIAAERGDRGRRLRAIVDFVRGYKGPEPGI